jgi:hypothetical protein
MLPETFQQKSKPFWIRCWFPAIVSYMAVHERCAGFKSLLCGFDLLVNRGRHGWIVSLCRQGSSDGDGNDARCCHLSSFKLRGRSAIARISFRIFNEQRPPSAASKAPVLIDE